MRILKKLGVRYKKIPVSLLFMGLFAVIGTILLITSRATTQNVSIEAETGTLGAPAAIVADANASGGSAITFGGTVTPPTNAILFGSNEPDRPPVATSNIIGAVESQIGRQFDIIRYFHSDWTNSFSKELALANQGYVVSTSYKLWSSWRQVSDDLRTAGSVRRVEVENMARAMQTQMPGPFFMTLHHEPEDNINAAGGNSEQDYGDMFCAFNFVFKSVGNTKAKFAPFPIIDSYTSDNSKGARVFPGDQCIDWNGADLYMFFGKQKVENWRTIAQVAYNKNVNGTQRAATGWYQFATTDFTGKPCTIANNPTCLSNGYVKKLDGATEPKQSKGKKPIVIG